MIPKKFGYEPMIENEEDFAPSDKKLNVLAKAMSQDLTKIPSGYTYLGQFIDHDISLDSAVVDRRPPWDIIPYESIYNMRTPWLDLETIYGHKNPTNIGELSRASILAPNSAFLKLGDTVPGLRVNKVCREKDLPRNKGFAQIVDMRNDENLAVAQTQVAFIRFHNAVVRHLLKGGAKNNSDTFEGARELVILHYQWIVIHDYLPKVIKQSVLDDVLKNGNQFYFPEEKHPYIPLEFSTAAFRGSHSMIRNSYNWNRIFNDEPAPSGSPARLYELMQNTGKGGLGGKSNLQTDWLINWNWFYKLSGFAQNERFNYASAINTKLAQQLGFLLDQQGQPPMHFARESSLAALDLYRARASRVPSGQTVAKTIYGTGGRSLESKQIANLLPPIIKSSFSEETPLWFYLLAEGEIEEQGQRLGEIGSRIVAETLVMLTKLTRPSIFESDFRPDSALASYEGEFGMVEMFEFIADGDPEELNPVGEEEECECEESQPESLHTSKI